MRIQMQRTVLALLVFTTQCTSRSPLIPSGFAPSGSFGERTRVLQLSPGGTATIVAPALLDTQKPIELILYALPNGNTTAETMGRRMGEGVTWRHDIQHIAAQTRALRAQGMPQAVVVYLEADKKSWPEWRRAQGYEQANRRIVEIVDQLRAALGSRANVEVMLAGHSGGGSFMFGFIEGQQHLPSWLKRIAFLDANYNFEPKHGLRILEWLRTNERNTLVVMAYDDRNIMLDGKRVVSDSGGTWRASERMLKNFAAEIPLALDTLGGFGRHHTKQIEILVHPNPENRILHTEMIGEMNGYMHALLLRRPGYTMPVLKRSRVYDQWVE